MCGVGRRVGGVVVGGVVEGGWRGGWRYRGYRRYRREGVQAEVVRGMMPGHGQLVPACFSLLGPTSRSPEACGSDARHTG